MTKTNENGAVPKPLAMQLVMHEILVKNGGPMAAKDLIAATLADERVTVKGEKPASVVSAVLYKNKSLGKLFKLVSRGVFEALPVEPKAPKAEKPKAAPKPKPAVKTSAAKSKPKATTAKAAKATSDDVKPDPKPSGRKPKAPAAA